MTENDPPPGELRLAAVQCPHCEQVTMPNLLVDGSYVCSCPAERALPLGGKETDDMPAPVDDPSFTPCPERGRLPQDHGQFGRDVATEAFKPLADPPG